MRRRVAIFLAAALAFVGVTLAQVPGQGLFYLGGEDPWWRPLNPQGQSYGVTVGATRPSPAMPGELFLDMDGGADGGPILELWDATNSEWDDVSSEALSGLTDNTIPVYDSATGGFIDSGITDDASTITLTQTTITTAATTLNLTATTVDFTTAGLALTTGGVLTADANLDIQAVGYTWINGDGSATADALVLGASATADAQIYWTGSLLTFDVNATTTNGIQLLNGTAGNIHFEVSGGGADLIWDPKNPANTGLNALHLAVAEINATDGSDEVNMLLLDWNETDWATATEVWSAIRIDGITQDAQGAYSGLMIGDGLDYDIDFSPGTAARMRINDQGTLTIGDADSGDVSFVINSTDGGDSIAFGGTFWGTADYFTIEPTMQVGSNTGDMLVLNFAAANMSGSGLFRGVLINVSNGNHTGSSNVFNGLELVIDTADPEALEVGIDVQGSGDTAWDLAATFDAAVEQNTLRTDFNNGCRRFEAADGTAELVTDGGVNGASCDGQIQNFTYRIDGDQASPFIARSNAGLDIDNDGISNEGVEILVGASLDGTLDHGLVVGTSPAMYMRVNVTITSVSGTDNAYFGWRQSEAFVDNLVIATYDTYGVHLINNNAGNLVIQTGDDTADGTDENAVNADFADAETITFEVQVATNGDFTFYTDGTVNAETSATGAAATGEILVPVIGLLNDTDADTEMIINWIEIGEVI